MTDDEEIEARKASANLQPRSPEEVLRLIEEMRCCTAGGSSGAENLLEDRRREREQERAKNAW